MKVEFACPSCGAAGAVDESLAGRRARCKGCGYQFTIPRGGEGEPADDLYALEGPGEETSAIDPGPGPAPVFVATRGEGAPDTAPRSRKWTSARPRASRRRAVAGTA